MKFRRSKRSQQPRSSTRDKTDSPSTQKPAVFSYHAKRSQLQGERLQPEETLSSRSFARKFWRQLPTIFALAIILLAIGYNLTLSSLPKVVILGEQQSETLRGDAETYQKLMQLHMSQSLFYRSKLTTDTNKLTRELKEQYPEFKDLSVVIPIVGRRPVVQVQPATALFVLRNTKGSYLIDKDGRAILDVKGRTTPIGLPVIVDSADVDVTVGRTVLPLQSLDFVNEVIGQFKLRKITIGDMTLPARANELHVRLKDQPYIIKFNLEGNGRQQVGTFLALQEKLTSQNITPKEYVDVRVEEKAFYR